MAEEPLEETNVEVAGPEPEKPEETGSGPRTAEAKIESTGSEPATLEPPARPEAPARAEPPAKPEPHRREPRRPEAKVERPPRERGPREAGGRGERGGREAGGRREFGRPDRGRPEGFGEIDIEKLIADSLYLDNQAHAVVSRMRDLDSGTKSQLRRFYNAVRRACRAPESERQHQFVMLRARLAYTIARHSLRSLDSLERLLLQVTRKNDLRGYERFRDLFEAIVAYNE